MKWFLWLVLIVALVTGALYGVGRFLLSNDLAVTRTVTIERPRAAVFAMANDLRIAREWSPYYARDPEAEFAFSGEGPGPGQTMRWVSSVRDVGAGRISIVDSLENERIDSIIELGERATLNSTFEINRVEGGAAAAWSVTARCAEGAINVPCRYMNLILQGQIGAQLEDGLERLKTLAEKLPNYDFERLSPELAAIDPQRFVYSLVVTSPEELGGAEALAIGQVRDFMNSYNLTQSGPLTRVLVEQDGERMSFRVGFPYSGATPLTAVGVQLGETPSGEAMRVLVEGTTDQVQRAYREMYTFLCAHRIVPRTEPIAWEVVQGQSAAADGVARQRMDIYIPINDAPSGDEVIGFVSRCQGEATAS